MFHSLIHTFRKHSFVRPSWLVVFALAAFTPYTTHAQTLPPTVEITAGDFTQTLSASDLSSWFHLDTRILIDRSYRSEAENTSYCPTSTLYCDLALSKRAHSHYKVIFESTVNHESVANFVASLSNEVNQDPLDAVFGVSDESQVIITQNEKQGRRLQESESTALILRALAEGSTTPIKIALATEITEPKIVATDRERLGLRELVGEGHTNFVGSPKNRLFNINRALKQFQNILIAPNEEFSFVKYLGDVDGEHGYLPELVIKNNKTEPEFGGGICQVSSTVFRAAIYSGLKITERRNHAYPVQYYKPYGMDATIYIPKPDLKFTNNTPGYILVQSIIDGNDLTFRFFGTKDGRSVSVDGPHILERGGDGSMKTVFTQEVNNANGENFIRDSFWSNYKSPSLFPHPGQETIYTSKPAGWSEKQWKEYQNLHP